MSIEEINEKLEALMISNVLNYKIGSLHDFVCDNYEDLSKDFLKELILGLDSVLKENNNDKDFRDLENRALMRARNSLYK